MATRQWPTRAHLPKWREDVGEAHPKGPELRIGPLIALGDVLALVLASGLVLATDQGPAVTPGSVALVLAGWFIVLANLSASGAYRSRLHLSVLDEMPSILGRVFAAAALTELGARVVLGEGDVIVMFSLAAVLILVGRITSYATVHAVRQQGIAHHRTLVVGAGKVGTEIASHLVEARQYGLEPVAFFDPCPLAVEGRDDTGIDVITNGSVADAIRSTGVDVVIVAFMSIHEGSLVSVIRECGRMRTEIMCVPRLFELMHDEGFQMDRVGSIPLLRLRRSAHRSQAWGAKRLFDIVAAAIALVVLSPVLALAALGVLFFLGRPILFRQMRLGKDNIPFEILKFRTLPAAPGHETDADWRNADRQPNRFGRFLRNTSIDELPQLVNILRGDMSLVGPRPERPLFAHKFSGDFPGYVDRHRVPAGLTGLAQVEGLRGDTSIHRRAAFDNAYVESWTLWNDCKIILRTVSSVLRGRGE